MALRHRGVWVPSHGNPSTSRLIRVSHTTTTLPSSPWGPHCAGPESTEVEDNIPLQIRNPEMFCHDTEYKILYKCPSTWVKRLIKIWVVLLPSHSASSELQLVLTWDRIVNLISHCQMYSLIEFSVITLQHLYTLQSFIHDSCQSDLDGYQVYCLFWRYLLIHEHIILKKHF